MVEVTMKGLLEPVSLEDDWVETMNALNLAAANGKEFVATRTGDGDNILLKMENILTIKEIESDDPIGSIG
jgi:hypothetical protein